MAKELGVDPPGGHKHSGHEAIATGAANACPICQAYKIGNLQGQVDKMTFRDGQLIAHLDDVDKMLKVWLADATMAIDKAPKAVRDALVNRAIDIQEVRTKVRKVMHHLLPGNEDVDAETSAGTAAKDSGARLFKTRHPIFGSIAKNGAPTPEQAFEAGVAGGRKLKR